MSEKWQFGDYAAIEMKRHGVANEMYVHKVVSTGIKSNAWVDVPVQSPAKEVLHRKSVEVVGCVVCGISERKILRFRADDLQKYGRPPAGFCGAPDLSKVPALEAFADEVREAVDHDEFNIYDRISVITAAIASLDAAGKREEKT